MEDKRLLNDEELNTVVGGLGNEKDIQNAFNMAEDHFKHLSHDKYNNNESSDLLNRMRSECKRMSMKNSPSESQIIDAIKRLEELCSSLMVTNTYLIPNYARDILKELKCRLGI